MNQVYLTGNVGKDPKFQTRNNFSFLTFSIGVSEGYKDKDGQWQNKTTWVNCKALGKMAEKFSDIIRKGTSVFIHGKIEAGSYEKDGRKVYFTNVVASEIGLFARPQQQQPQDDMGPF